MIATSNIKLGRMTTCIVARTKVICTIDFITENEPNKGVQRMFLPHPESPEFYSLNDEDILKWRHQ